MITDERVAPSALPDSLLAQGRYWATTEQLEQLTGERGAVLRTSLSRLRKEGRLFSPARGLYVIVPPEYRSWRVLPAEWFADALMKHLGRAYYVGFLSAASMHGAAHQHPQTTRIVTDRYTADRSIERVSLRFTTVRDIASVATEQRTVPTGYLTVSTREATLADLVWQPKLGGGISNVATVMKEIGPVDSEALARAAQLRGRLTARRLGWLLQRFRPEVDVHWLRVIARPREGDPSLLVPGAERGQLDQDWWVRVNTAVEPDV